MLAVISPSKTQDFNPSDVTTFTQTRQMDYDTTMKEPLLHLPKAHGLYHPDNEKENCGVGFIAHIKGKMLLPLRKHAK
jgi:hypothetical protein